jgi:hypothetical protein
MNDLPFFDKTAHDVGYFTFMDRDEKTVLYAKGILNDIIDGYIVLTNKKLFFFFYSNINREKKFIATYPYIASADLKKGIFSSTLNVSSRKDTFKISRLNNSKASMIYEMLKKIISDNSEKA